MTISAQANLGNGHDEAVRRILTTLAAKGALVIGCQEAGDRGKVIDHWCKTWGWEAFYGEGKGASSTPIIWDKRVKATHLGTRPGTSATNTGKFGAGPNVVKAKVLNHGRFHEPGHKPFVLINMHNPASLYLPRRRALARKLVADAANMVKRREGHIEVRVVGDMNCRPNALVMRPLRKAGLKQRTKGRTHGARTIDHVWTNTPGRGKPVVIPSDHRGVLFIPKKENR